MANATASATRRSPCWRPPDHRLHDGLRQTTGVEPDLALVKYKKLVGGGMIKIVTQRCRPR